jgi:hypothetical protein
MHKCMHKCMHNVMHRQDSVKTNSKSQNATLSLLHGFAVFSTWQTGFLGATRFLNGLERDTIFNVAQESHHHPGCPLLLGKSMNGLS